MENEPDLLPDALTALSTAFAARLPQRAEGVTLEEMRQFLIEKITVLLNRNPAMLMGILYRVDVAERNVQHVLTEAPPAAIPHQLADLLIERQLQKLCTRRQYRERDA